MYAFLSHTKTLSESAGFVLFCFNLDFVFWGGGRIVVVRFVLACVFLVCLSVL